MRLVMAFPEQTPGEEEWAPRLFAVAARRAYPGACRALEWRDDFPDYRTP